MPQKNLNARSSTIDLLKAVSIFGVVFIHARGILGEESEVGGFLAYLFRFGVPCFIAVWAFFYEKGTTHRTDSALSWYSRQRFLHLLTVFAVWSLIYFLINVNWHTLTLKDLITKYWTGYGWSGQYFFIILFQLHLLFPYLRKIYEIPSARFLTIVTTLLLYVLWRYQFDNLPLLLQKLGCRPFVFWVPYALLGIMLARNSSLQVGRWLPALLILIPLESWAPEPQSRYYSPYLAPSILIASCALILTFLSSRLRISVPQKISSFLSFIGRNTMTIFVTNPLIIALFSFFLKDRFPMEQGLLSGIAAQLLSTILVFCSCMGMAWIINKCRLNGLLN